MHRHLTSLKARAIALRRRAFARLSPGMYPRLAAPQIRIAGAPQSRARLREIRCAHCLKAAAGAVFRLAGGPPRQRGIAEKLTEQADT